LSFKGNIIPGHKIILASRSSFFRSKFGENPNMDTLYLPDEVGSFDALYAMIEYMYTEDLNLARIGKEEGGGGRRREEVGGRRRE
jgi:hypothetical protein